MKTQRNISKQNIFKTVSLFGLLMIFSLSASPLFAQSNERTVTGVVNSLDGPVFGASIVLKGSNTGVVSNAKGEFTFPRELKENDVLLVSYLGYETDEIIIAGNTTFVEPFLEDIAVVVVAAMRTKNTETTLVNHTN
ncbi:MAG: carboxypeptidase-like regulatory domain-containing protein [Flavobacteriaceae bacterium]|nr:carboxypeptidase-like regulatory domain-containing protein [Flavobacteriaceae bacterium]